MLGWIFGKKKGHNVVGLCESNKLSRGNFVVGMGGEEVPSGRFIRIEDDLDRSVVLNFHHPKNLRKLRDALDKELKLFAKGD